MSRYTKYLGNNYFEIIKGREEEFKAFIEKYDWGKTLLHINPPKEIGDCWVVWFGYERDYSTDINHFDPEEQSDWFAELSLLIKDKIDLICFDEEFPVIQEKGYAHRLVCENGECKVTNLILQETSN